MARPKKVVVAQDVATTIEPQVTDKPNMPVMLRDTKEIKCIKNSEYDRLIHICL